MKKSALSNSVASILTEATRFGSKEISEVMKYANAFSIGMEFEFHVSEFYTPEDEDAIDQYIESDYAYEYADQIVNQRYGKIVSEMSSELNDLTNSTLLDNFNAILDFSDVMEDGEGLDAEGYLTDEYSEIFEALTSYEYGLLSRATYDTLANIQKLTDGSPQSLPIPIIEAFDEALNGDFDFVVEKVSGAIKAIETARRVAQKTPHGIRKAVATLVLDESFSLLLTNAEDLSGSFNTIDGLVDDVLNSSVLDDLRYEYRKVYAKRANYEDYREQAQNSKSPQAVAFIKEKMLANPIFSSTLSSVVEDASVKDGAEVITTPIKLKQAISILSDYLDFIKEYGVTSDYTGLHINISHRFFRTNRIQDINFLKLVILLDPDMIQSMSKNEKRKGWKERNDMVAGLGKVIDYEIDSLIRAYKVGGFKSLEETLTEKLIIAEKFRSINFTNSVLSTKSDQRRVELRYPGGKGYENRYDDITRDILFGCYTVLAAIEDDFLKQDYLKGILRFLDRSTKKKYGMSFLDAVKR